MPVLRRMLESRSIENPAVPLTSKALVEWLDGSPGLSGVTVNETTAMRHIAVFRAVEMIAGTCAALPLKAYRRPSRERVDSLVLDDPHPELTSFEVWESAYACLLLWGNAYFRKLKDGAGRVRYLWPIHPRRVQVDVADGKDGALPYKVFRVTSGNGGEVTYTNDEILHIPGLGYDGRVGLSRIQAAKQGIGLGMATEEYAARFFGSGQLLSGILTTDQDLDQAKADGLKARWKAKVGTGLGSAHDIAVLGSGATFQPVSIPPEDAQLLESQQWGVTQIARLFGVPPHALGDVSGSTSWGTGIEQQTLGMVKFTLDPTYLTRVEQRVTKEVLLSSNVYAEYTREGLLRGDAKARAAFYTSMRQMKAMTANEVRVRENLEPYDGGDVFENPNITVDEPADEGEANGQDQDAS